MALTGSQRQRGMKMRELGFSWKAIGASFGVSERTAIDEIRSRVASGGGARPIAGRADPRIRDACVAFARGEIDRGELSRRLAGA
jgi:hypothetical protein